MAYAIECIEADYGIRRMVRDETNGLRLFATFEAAQKYAARLEWMARAHGDQYEVRRT